VQTSVIVDRKERKVRRLIKRSLPDDLNSARKKLDAEHEPEPKKTTPFWTWFIANPRSRESH
jgi:hypothetical protein